MSVSSGVTIFCTKFCQQNLKFSVTKRFSAMANQQTKIKASKFCVWVMLKHCVYKTLTSTQQKKGDSIGLSEVEKEHSYP